MKKITFLLALIGFLSLQSIFAQQTITGKVTSSDDGSALPGVSLIIKGTTNGTSTDFDGNFSLNAIQGQMLVVSYIGYNTKEVEVNGNELNIQLVPGVNLSEVVFWKF